MNWPWRREHPSPEARAAMERADRLHRLTQEQCARAEGQCERAQEVAAHSLRVRAVNHFGEAWEDSLRRQTG